MAATPKAPGGDPSRAIPFKEAIEEYLRVSLKTGHSLVNRGELRTFTIGARRFVAEAELARFIVVQQARASNEGRAAKVRKAVEARRKPATAQPA